MAGRVISFTEDNVVTKSKGDYDFPKFKLERKDDIGRLIILEDPTFAYVHNIQHPVVEDGVAAFIQKQTKRGETYSVPKLAFVSRPICLGDDGVLAENGLDPKNCPVCAFAEKNPDRMPAPQRRFAMHVVQYNTKKNGDLITPFGVQIKVWAFTDRYFTKIWELKKEWGDLRKRDLILRCENPDFAGYDISIGANAAYLESAERTKLIKDTFVEDNKTPDLSIFCGKDTELRWIKSDLQKVETMWAAFDRATGKAKPADETKDFDSAIGTLLGDDKADVKDEEPSWATSEAPASEGGTADDFDDLLAGL